MDNEEALRRITEGGSILCLDTPLQIEFGIDQLTWITGDTFSGMKMIPAGFHFIHWRYTGKKVNSSQSQSQEFQSTNLAFLPISGFFIFIKPGQVIVRKWDNSNEDFTALSEEQAGPYIEGVRRMDFDRKLAPYPDQIYEEWNKLTCCISNKTIDRCCPLYNKIAASPFTTSSTEEENASEENKEDLEKYREIHSFRFFQLPTRWTPNECTGSERSKYFMDKSYLLEYAVATHFRSWSELFGEFQLSFVAFWLAESFEGFEQWKQLMIAFSTCEHLINEAEETFKPVIQILTEQFKNVPEDFFVDILAAHNFLEPCLRNLYEILEDSHPDTAIYREYVKLKRVTKERFKTSFSVTEYDSEDEFSPVVVTL